jgi:hypothetical protein
MSTIIASFIAGLGVELASPYVKPIVDKIINRIKARFGKNTDVESNMIALDEVLDSKTTTIIINGNAKIICNRSTEDINKRCGNRNVFEYPLIRSQQLHNLIDD